MAHPSTLMAIAAGDYRLFWVRVGPTSAHTACCCPAHALDKLVMIGVLRSDGRHPAEGGEIDGRFVHWFLAHPEDLDRPMGQGEVDFIQAACESAGLSSIVSEARN